MIIFLFAFAITLFVIITLCRKAFRSTKTVTMRCPDCGHEWTMNKTTYMTTPYAQRGVNKLFVCSECGSQGNKK